MMRVLLVVAASALVLGCTELVAGPRVVHYTDTRFYVRYVPVFDGEASVNALAEKICERGDKRAQLLSTESYFPLDTRYANYACT